MGWEEVTDCPKIISGTRGRSQTHQIPLGSSSLQNYAIFLATILLIINARSACWGPMLGLMGGGQGRFQLKRKLGRVGAQELQTWRIPPCPAFAALLALLWGKARRWNDPDSFSPVTSGSTTSSGSAVT